MTSSRSTNRSNGQSPTVPSAGGSSRMFILGIVGVVVLGLAVVAFVASGRDAGPAAADQTAAVQIDGAPLASMESGFQIIDAVGQSAVGSVAPTLTGTSYDGSDVVIEPDGNPKVVYFLAHWCPHCQREVPAIMDLIEGGALPDGLDVYAVSTAVDSGSPNFPPSAWLESEGVAFPVLRDDADSSALMAYGPSGFPYAVYLDGENRVVAQSAGELDPVETEALWQATAAAG